jgi:hypothetical protein
MLLAGAVLVIVVIVLVVLASAGPDNTEPGLMNGAVPAVESGFKARRPVSEVFARFLPGFCRL